MIGQGTRTSLAPSAVNRFKEQIGFNESNVFADTAQCVSPAPQMMQWLLCDYRHHPSKLAATFLLKTCCGEVAGRTFDTMVQNRKMGESLTGRVTVLNNAVLRVSMVLCFQFSQSAT